MKIAKPVRILLSSGAVLAVLAGGFAAEARTFVSVGVGLPLAFPVYAPPPPVVYAPPVAYEPPAAYVPAAPAPVAYSRTTCREFQKTIVIDGQPQNGFGVACLQPDGTWRVAP